MPFEGRFDAGMGGGIGSLLNQAGDVIDEVTGAPREGNEQKFRRYLKGKNFANETDTFDAEPGDFKKIGEFVVPAQERYRWGYGSAKHPTNQGYLYVEINDAEGNPIDGSIRIQQRDAQERELITVEELDLETLRGDPTDRDTLEPLPEQTDRPKVGRDSKLALAVETDNEVTIDWSESTIKAPVAVYPVRNV